MNINREEAYRILLQYLKNKNLIKHCLASEAAMKGLCVHLDPNATEEEIEKWGIAGLLHDGDYEETVNTPERHGLLITERVDLPKDIAYAINAHNFQNTKIKPKSHMDYALTSAETLTGLIVACALVHPEKKIGPLTAEFVLKRFGEKSFAKGANREVIKLCEEKLGIPLQKFIGIVLSSMQKIAPELGL
jgi:predicted hydrolase (HD superfamily)